MIKRTALALAAAAGLCLVQTAPATAATTPSSLTLTNQALGSTVLGDVATNSQAVADFSLATSSASAYLGDTFSCAGSCKSSSLATDSSNNSYNFYDDFVFKVSDSTVDAVSSSISLQSLESVTGLEERIYTVSGNSAPVLGNSPAGLQTLGLPGTGAGGWSNPANLSLGSGESTSYTALSDVLLGAGTYVLEVRGDVTGSAGGSYSGNINLTPVPVPAALPLLLSGLGLLGGMFRKRLASAGG